MLVGEELKTKRNARNKYDKGSSVYSNTNAGGRRAQHKKECPKRKKEKTTRRSSEYSNINAGGRGAQRRKEVPETKRKQHDKTKLKSTRTPTLVGEELKGRTSKISGRKEDQTFEPWWPNGKYLWISYETRKELISRPKDYDEILLIRITRCKNIIRHAERLNDYNDILFIRTIGCKNSIRYAKRQKKTHTPRGGQND